jgi:hypothetical protein
MNTLYYSEGYKYQLEKEFKKQTPITGSYVNDFYFLLEPSGMLTVSRGYAWDGASGPTWDTSSSMAASLVHDVFCQMERDGRLDYVKWHKVVNEFFVEMCREDGMWAARANLWGAAVEFANAGDPAQGPDRTVICINQ